MLCLGGRILRVIVGGTALIGFIMKIFYLIVFPAIEIFFQPLAGLCIGALRKNSKIPLSQAKNGASSMSFQSTGIAAGCRNG